MALGSSNRRENNPLYRRGKSQWLCNGHVNNLTRQDLLSLCQENFNVCSRYVTNITVKNVYIHIKINTPMSCGFKL